MKKVIATVLKPRPSDFGISERMGKECYFKDGVFVQKGDDGGDDYLKCEFARCDNGDPITVGSFYETDDDGIVQVTGLTLTWYFRCKFNAINGDGFEVKGLDSSQFDREFW